jgi:hypothetical protein
MYHAEYYQISPFPDLLKSNPYYYCIAYAEDKGIVQWYRLDNTGTMTCGDGGKWTTSPFCEKNETTRIEAAAMLLRQAHLWDDTRNSELARTIAITDVSNYWYGYAKKAIDIGLMTLSGTEVYAEHKITRGEFAIMAAKMLEYNQCAKENSENTFASRIIIQDAWGTEIEKTLFKKEDIFRLVPKVSQDKPEYTYSWTAIDGITGKKVEYSWRELPGDKLGVWNWYIELIIRDERGMIIGAPTTTISIIDTAIRENAPPAGKIPLPSVLITTDTLTPPLGKKTSFEATASGAWPFQYIWDFGDGTKISGGANIDHTYTTPWVYTVTVTLTDKNGNTAQSSLIIEVIGILDKDGDGISDRDDLCPAIETNAYTNDGKLILWNQLINQAESSIDTDNDGIKDINDSCPGVIGPISNNGCPLLSEFLSSITKNTCLIEEMQNRGGLIIEGVCESCPCTNTISLGNAPKKCDIFFPTILSPDRQTIYSRWPLYQIH